MTPELSRRLGQALGTHSVSPQERTAVVLGASGAETWPDLPEEVRALVTSIEQRPASPSTAG